MKRGIHLTALILLLVVNLSFYTEVDANKSTLSEADALSNVLKYASKSGRPGRSVITQNVRFRRHSRSVPLYDGTARVARDGTIVINGKRVLIA
ncbi:unnamed protein product [Meloidogyne enterolobii]|uniref:Uncharacterized protein n=1 Tax=Meloidogyne enterolobii TaxID=390850 RepID=A0ACB1ACA5_MELEN